MTSAHCIVVAVEDELSGEVMRRLIAASGRNFAIDRLINTRGNGQIKAGINKFKSACHAVPHVILTDLDKYSCPLALLQAWKAIRLPPQLLFRIAVREVESWLLADRDGIAEFLHVAVAKVPRNPESELDPKRSLINLARRSRKRRLVEELVPAQGSSASIGPLYNARLSEFVNTAWDIDRAKVLAESLSRTIDRLASFCRNK